MASTSLKKADNKSPYQLPVLLHGPTLKKFKETARVDNGAVRMRSFSLMDGSKKNAVEIAKA